MSMTLFAWVLIAGSLAMSLILMLAARARRAPADVNHVAACRAGLEDIAARLKRGQLNDAEADTARLALLSQQPTSSWPSLRTRLGSGPLTMAASVFFLVAGVGAATSLVKERTAASPSAHVNAGADDETLVRLKDYARTSGAEQAAAPTAATGTLLPDVNTMITRLATRLETAPDDLEGWRLLGWSYAHTGQHSQAAAAFARALTLDPSSTELQQARAEAEAKSRQSALPTPASTATPDTGDKSDAGSEPRQATGSDGPTRHDGATIRAMVDGLADRLARAPQDVEGWTRLMRSRVVLGETEVATSALRKALDIFKDDAAASGQIAAAATELGLKAD